MNTVITGGNGFIGTRLSADLARCGHQVTVISRNAMLRPWPTNVRCIEATIDDASAIVPALLNADYLLHLAWDTTPGTSQLQPTLEAACNLLPTTRLLEQLQRFPRCKLVFMSSGGALFSRCDQTPLAEDAAISPMSYYGAAKAATEQMLRAYHAQTGNSVIILRPSNVFGPGQQSKRLFGIVPTIMNCLREGTAFEIWGNGETIRDYLYVDDFADLVKRVLAHGWPANHLETFHIGSGVGVSINELCSAIESVAHTPLARRYRPARTVDTPSVVLNAAKALKILGWKPEMQLEQGLDATWTWTNEHT